MLIEITSDEDFLAICEALDKEIDRIMEVRLHDTL